MSGWMPLLVAGSALVVAAAVALASGVLHFHRSRRPVAPRLGGPLPSGHRPALIAACLNRGRVDTRMLVATWLDLINRGVVPAEPVDRDDRVAADLQLFAPLTPNLTGWEAEAARMLAQSLEGSPTIVPRLLERLAASGKATARAYAAMSDRMTDALYSSGLLVRRPTAKISVLGALSGWLAMVLAARAIWPDASAFVTTIGILFGGGQTILAASLRHLAVRPGPEIEHVIDDWRSVQSWMSSPDPADVKEEVDWAELLIYSVAFGHAAEVWEACDRGPGLTRSEPVAPVFMFRWSKPAAADSESRPRLVGVISWMIRLLDSYSTEWTGVDRMMLKNQPPEEVGIYTRLD